MSEKIYNIAIYLGGERVHLYGDQRKNLYSDGLPRVKDLIKFDDTLALVREVVWCFNESNTNGQRIDLMCEDISD